MPPHARRAGRVYWSCAWTPPIESVRTRVSSDGTLVPGYKALPVEFSGPAAEHVRYAEVLQRAGDPDEAVRLLEATLELYALTTPELPGWLCGRLAALYRALKRYDDEG